MSTNVLDMKIDSCVLLLELIYTSTSTSEPIYASTSTMKSISRQDTTYPHPRNPQTPLKIGGWVYLMYNHNKTGGADLWHLPYSYN